MPQQISLKEAERKVFRTKHNDGLWDILLGCYFLTWVGAPYLSPRLGDFWSTAVFLPVWAALLLAALQIRKRVVVPRMGIVEFGSTRKARLKRFTFVMLTINVLALILGLWAATHFRRVPGQMISITFGLILLTGLSAAAYFLDFRRLYIYGLLTGFSPVVGEWLWTHGRATHHGLPITLGTSGGIMIVVGLVVFLRLLRNNPLPAVGSPSEQTRDGQPAN